MHQTLLRQIYSAAGHVPASGLFLMHVINILCQPHCPCSMWAYLTLFYASGPDLAVAWSFIAAAQPLAQVCQHPCSRAAAVLTQWLVI